MPPPYQACQAVPAKKWGWRKVRLRFRPGRRGASCEETGMQGAFIGRLYFTVSSSGNPPFVAGRASSFYASPQGLGQVQTARWTSKGDGDGGIRFTKRTAVDTVDPKGMQG